MNNLTSQNKRFLDTTLIGPLMIVAGLTAKNPLIKTLLLVNGAATIVYNNKNYVAREQELYNAYMATKV